MNEKLLYEKLEEKLLCQQRKPEDIEKIKEAYETASKHHAGQYRVSEEPYIIHPIEVARILADLQADTPTLCAALLHDVLEDTDTKPEEIKDKFGEEVLKLVNGVTKLSKIQFKSKEEQQSENFRRMFIAMAQDIRVILLKLADRLHNMRTLNYMTPEKQKKIAVETLEIFAPLANRLGIGKIKAELEDLCLRYINPEKYYEIARLVAQSKAERELMVETLIEKIQIALKNAKIKASITGRSKHYYSIYRKMEKLQKSYHDLYDITAVRVMVDTEKECYEVLGLIHSQFKPIPGRFKDYIAMPKNNLYRSLHTSVVGPRGKPMEVQIRTYEMHEEAEYGIAAHWKYKESGVSTTASSAMDKKFAWLRKLVELEQDVTNAKEYVDMVKIDIFSDQVFVFSPKGDVYDLVSGATPIDFAYRVHTEVGHRTTGALVNGRIVTLDTKLNNGDIVEILTSKHPNPRLDWLNIVATNQAKSKIKHWFRKNQKEQHTLSGRAALEQELTKAVFDEYNKNGKFLEIAKLLNYQTEEDLFAGLGYGETTINKIISIINKFKKAESEDGSIIKTSAKKSDKKGDTIIGLEGLLYNISKCCMPIPGEPIIGVITRSRGVSVHRIDCQCLDGVDPERLMKISWANTNPDKKYEVNLRIEANDRIGLLQSIVGKIADNNANITRANTKSNEKKFAVIELGIEITDIDSLNKIITALLGLPDVLSVKRIRSIAQMGHKTNIKINKNKKVSKQQTKKKTT